MVFPAPVIASHVVAQVLAENDSLVAASVGADFAAGTFVSIPPNPLLRL